MQKFETVEQYIDSFPPETKKLLRQLRRIIRKTAPKAEEVISYGMPGYKLNGMLVWFAGYKNHIGFYPKGDSAIKAFQKPLNVYKTSKGTIQLPLNEALPEKLLVDIIKFRIKENEEKF
jgi:uncharacterized protein YdhG (YjbR/CyaY superfamily)